MTGWRDGYWRSGDGLRLHYRDYPGDPARAAVLCIPGLTRNARDFADVAERLAGGRRVIVADLRGRGGSEWSPEFESYNAKVYLDDIVRLLDAADVPRVVVFGTSLGGIIAMLLGARGEPRLAGVLLNDIAPIVEEAGLERIRGYIGDQPVFADWDAAGAAMARTHAAAFPDYRPADWTAMARRLCREEEGGIVADFDPAIAILVAMPTPVPQQPWALIEGFRDIPGLLVHGVLSDILSADTAAATVSRLPQMELVTLDRIGHPPMLDEPQAAAGIDRLLARVDRAA